MNIGFRSKDPVPTTDYESEKAAPNKETWKSWNVFSLAVQDPQLSLSTLGQGNAYPKVWNCMLFFNSPEYSPRLYSTLIISEAQYIFIYNLFLSFVSQQ